MSADLEALAGLADRCEAARVDEQRAILTVSFVLAHDPPPVRTPERETWAALSRKLHRFLSVGAYLDAAVLLVPEGCTWAALTDYELPGRGTVYGWPIGSHATASPVLARCDAATPALALTAACLRARALSRTAGEGEG